MKITHMKKEDRRWMVVLETEDEARNFIHSFGCSENLKACTRSKVRYRDFQREVFKLLLDAGMPT